MGNPGSEVLTVSQRLMLLSLIAFPLPLTAQGAAEGEPQTVVLNDTEYRIEWLSPNRVLDPEFVETVESLLMGRRNYDGVCATLWGEPRKPADAGFMYWHHVWPHYNLQENILVEEIWPAKARPRNGRWGLFWLLEMPGLLVGKVDWFALLAYDGGALAGMIRFLPKTLTVAHYGGWTEDEHRAEWTDDIIWIGAASTDPQGVEDGLDVELIRRAVDYARDSGFKKVQATGWSDVIPYAMWGQSFRVSAYETAGFRRIATTDGIRGGFDQMVAGVHGEYPKQQVAKYLEEIADLETAHQCHIVKYDLTVLPAEPMGQDRTAH